MIRIYLCAAAMLLALVLAPAASAVERDVQYKSVNFDTGVIELHNFGTTTQPLAGWRLCTSNDTVIARYTAAAPGFGAASLAPGESLFIHTQNDASGPNAINLSSLGGTFAPMTNDDYGLSIYWPNGGSIGFSDPNDMVDHVQWSIDGIGDANADLRAGTAVSAGLWVSATDWVATNADSKTIELAETGTILHDSGSYSLASPISVLPAWMQGALIALLLASLGFAIRRQISTDSSRARSRI